MIAALQQGIKQYQSMTQHSQSRFLFIGFIIIISSNSTIVSRIDRCLSISARTVYTTSSQFVWDLLMDFYVTKHYSSLPFSNKQSSCLQLLTEQQEQVLWWYAILFCAFFKKDVNILRAPFHWFGVHRNCEFFVLCLRPKSGKQRFRQQEKIYGYSRAYSHWLGVWFYGSGGCYKKSRKFKIFRNSNYIIIQENTASALIDHKRYPMIAEACLPHVEIDHSSSYRSQEYRLELSNCETRLYNSHRLN